MIAGIVKALWHNAILTYLLAAIGLAASLVQLAQAILPETTEEFFADYTAEAAVISTGLALIFGLVVAWPYASVTWKSDQGWQVQICRGDLFEFSPIVLTANRNVSIQLAVVGPDSLVGQLVNRWFSGDASRLAAEVPAADSPHPVRLGAIYAFNAPGGRKGWLLAAPLTTPTGSELDPRSLTFAYRSLWDHLRANNVTEVNVPIIGSGFAGVRMPHQAVLYQLLLTFHAACIDRRVTRTLRIVVPEHDYDVARLAETGRFMRSLGYTRIRK